MASEIKIDEIRNSQKENCANCGRLNVTRNGFCHRCFNEVYLNQKLRHVPITSQIYQYHNYRQFKKAITRWLRNNDIQFFLTRDLPLHFQCQSYLKRAHFEKFIVKHDVIRERGTNISVWRLKA